MHPDLFSHESVVRPSTGSRAPQPDRGPRGVEAVSGKQGEQKSAVVSLQQKIKPMIVVWAKQGKESRVGPFAGLGPCLGPLPRAGGILSLKGNLSTLISNVIANQPGAGINNEGIARVGEGTNAVIKYVSQPRMDTRHIDQTGFMIPFFINSVLIPEKEKISQHARVSDRIETACRQPMNQSLIQRFVMSLSPTIPE
jgi:hypothetical protein